MIWSTICLMIVACSKKQENEILPEEGKDNLTLETGAFSKLKPGEITLEGEIKTSKDSELKDYGFIIATKNEMGQITSEEELSLGSKLSSEHISFTYKPSKAFSNDIIYSYTLYVRTNRSFLKGLSKEFVLNGPLITGSAELNLYKDDQFLVEGNFANLNDDYYVIAKSEYQNIQIPFTLNKEKTRIVLKVPNSSQYRNKTAVTFLLLNKKNSFHESQQKIGNITVYGKLFEPEQMEYGYTDYLTLSGDALPIINDHANPFRIILGDLLLPYSQYIRVSEIVGLKGLVHRLGFTNGIDTVIFKKPLIIKIPNIESLRIVEYAAHPYTMIQLRGMFFESMPLSGNSFTIGNFPLELYGASNDHQSLTMGQVPEGTYQVNLKNDLINISSTNTIEIRDLQWTSTDRTSSYYGDLIKLTGNFIKGATYNIWTDNMMDEYPYRGICQTDGEFSFEVGPDMKNGKSFQLGYLTRNNTYHKLDKKQNIEIKGMTLESVLPLTGSVGDVITVKGNGAKYINKVFFGGKAIEYYNIEIIDNHTIKFLVPALSSTTAKLVFLHNDEIYSWEKPFEFIE